MNMTIKEYIETTKILVLQMSEENQDYFDKLQSYVLLATLLRDEKSIREQIYNMAVDLREAEQDGLTAEGFFGKDAKKMADAIIAHSPAIQLRALSRIILMVGLILSFYQILEDFSNYPVLILSPVLYLLDFLLGSLAVYLIFKCLSCMIYSRRPWFWGGLIGIVVVSVFTLVQFLGSWLGATWTLAVASPWDVLLVVFISFLYLIGTATDRTFWAFIYPILSFIAVGILKRFFVGIDPANTWIHLWLPILIILSGLILFYWQGFRQFKK